MKKVKLKKILLLVFIIIAILFAYNLFKVFTSNKQNLEILTSRQISTSGTVEAIVGVKDKKTEKSLKSKIIVEMRDSNKKKVKKFKETYEIEEGEKANISAKLPENIEPGNYTLQITSKSGLKSDTEDVSITITDKASSNAVISLDKGIYKPGDSVNFRALLISKNNDAPKSQDVEISIYDANQNRVYVNNAKTSEFGIVSGQFQLADEVNSGEYKICVSTKDYKSTKLFTVNPYVVPTFEVKVENSQDTYRIGDIANISVNARYFFGEPVVNATVKGTINGESISGLTNENGVFEYQKEIKDPGKYDVKVEVVDSSNYLIEASKTFYATNNAFEIEILPENDDIVKGIENKIYFITKKVDGTPIKTHIDARIGSISRQVVTDEAGIGILSLNANDVGKLDMSTTIYATAKDMNNEVVRAEYDTQIQSYNGVVVSLDKLKYKQNEDITIYLNSTTDVANKEIFIYKNNDLLKVVSTSEDKITFNLEDTYGLIDIYTKNNIRHSYYPIIDDVYMKTDTFLPTNSYRSSSTSYSKKTIFISPEKTLNIDITKDKEEYKPGEKLNLNIKTETEKKEAIDTALLVSILDEAVLSLADNDLSIDNIKLALGNIELSDGITLADLYAEILDSQAENKLRLVLLRQSTENPNLVEQRTGYYSDTYEKYIFKAVAFGVVAAFMVFAYISTKFLKVKNGIVAVINLFVVYALITTAMYDLLYYEFDFSELSTLIIPGIISLMLYVLVLYKYNVAIFNCIVNLVILPGIVLIAYYFTSEELYNELLSIIVVLLPAITMTICVVCSRKFKLNKFFTKLKDLSAQCTISEIVYFLAALISSMLNISGVGTVVVLLIIYWISQKIYNKKIKKEDIKDSIEITTPFGIIVVIVVIALVLFGIYFYNSSTNSIQSASAQISPGTFEFDTFDAEQFNESVSKSNSSLSINEFFNNDFYAKASVIAPTIQEEVTENQISQTAETTNEVEESVRNIFLESLAFIPELISTNGKAETTIDISDNITTWNIQAVGNTKDGRIGYNTSTFKVFKEFFIDFSLPTNAVVTDKTSIPLTVYNYTENVLSVRIQIPSTDWAKIDSTDSLVPVEANSTKMIYIPIEFLKAGNNVLRIESSANGVSDIVEKTVKVSPNGFRKSAVVSSGSTENKLELDHFTNETAIENTRKLNLKIYPSVISQTVEGMENIFRMPTGCFEQTSSSLYPNILALKYLEDNGLNVPEIKEKALDYISKGYQRILTFETSQKGGYSLYGEDPAENVLTAFGLMELTDLKEVYDVDETVTNNMVEYLFDEQNINGTFDIGSTYIGSASSTDDLAMNAYIIWALSEACPEDNRLNKSVEYLEKKLSETRDNYTLALMANVFSNVKSASVKTAINKLMESVQEDEDGGAYITSEIRDYWGSCGRYQNVQTTALTSMVLTKEKSHNSTNNALLQHIIKSKDEYGTWSTTQATILSLKAVNQANSKESISNQTVAVTVNGNTKEVEIKDTPLDIYELEFNNIKEENKISIEFKKGTLYYEVVEEYYVGYDTIEVPEKPQIYVAQTLDNSVNVNDIMHQNITVANFTDDFIRNALVQISIPQGCSVNESSLAKLKHLGYIEKYEYNYGTINLYVRNLAPDFNLNLEVEYRANYPEQVTGGMVKVYDYYNPSIEGFAKPESITIK